MITVSGRDGAAGEGGLDAVVGLDDRLAARVAVEARVLELHAERGDAEGDEQAAGDQRRHERALEDAGEDGAPDARLALGLVAALGDVGHAALLEPVLLGRGSESIAGRKVIEPSTATATTSIVPMPKAEKIGLPANSSPAIAVITVRPEMSTARPDVAAAISSAASAEWPRSRSSIMRRE